MNNYKLSNPPTLFLAIFIFNCFTLCGQEKREFPRNYIGLLGGVEWNSFSGGWGLEYESQLYGKNRFQIGAKASHVFRYKYGNFSLLTSPCCETVSHTQIMASSYFYTSGRKDFSGFFLNAGLGLAYSDLKNKSQNSEYLKGGINAAFDLGLGLQFYISDRLVLRWNNIVSYGPYYGAFTNTRFSLGF